MVKIGSNSTEVSYGFGQMGSAFQNLAKPVYPPKGLVIVAIQFMADNTPTTMHTEVLNSQGPQYIGTLNQEDEAANYLGVTEAACTGNRFTTNFTNDTVEISASNDLIKAGQYVLLVDTSDTIDTGLTVDAETSTPVYYGPNQAGVKVVSVSGPRVVLSEVLTPAASQTLVFLDEFHGAGGTTAQGIKFPKGLTIFGRWTKVVPEADADGGIICYFGK